MKPLPVHQVLPRSQKNEWSFWEWISNWNDSLRIFVIHVHLCVHQVKLKRRQIFPTFRCRTPWNCLGYQEKLYGIGTGNWSWKNYGQNFNKYYFPPGCRSKFWLKDLRSHPLLEAGRTLLVMGTLVFLGICCQSLLRARQH